MPKYIFHTVFSLLLSVYSLALYGVGIDNIRFDFPDWNDALTHNGVNHIIQDHKGYLWIATQEGLNRYDGYSIRRFLNRPGDSTSLQHNGVLNLLEDNKRRIWICTENGICRYDRETERFIRYQINGKEITNCHTFTQLSDGRIVTGIFGKLYFFDEARQEFIAIEADLGTPKPVKINALCEDGNDILWIGTNVGIRCFDLRQMKTVSLPFPGRQLSNLRQNAVLCIEKDADSRLWIGGWSVFAVYDPRDHSVTEPLFDTGRTQSVLRTIEFDRYGNTWVGGENGINIFDRQLHFHRHISHDINDVSGLSDNPVYTIFRDRANNMWVGTYFGGVNVMYDRTAEFTVYPAGYSNHHLSGMAVRQIIADGDNGLWIATEDGGLNHFDRRTRTFEHYIHPTDKIALRYHNVHCLQKDHEGILWIGTFSGGITRYDPRNGRTTYPRCIRGGIEATDIFALLVDPDGDVWIGSSRGLFLHRSGDGDRITSVNKGQIGVGFIYCLAHTPDGSLWVGTRNGGLYRYNKKSNTVEKIPGNTYQNFISTLFVDQEGNLWVGTNNGGLRRFDRSGKSDTTFTEQNGLPSNSIKSIIQDDRGYLWVGTSAGLSRLDPGQSTFKSYGIYDGLSGYRFNYSSAFKTADGELFFGTTKGMISLHPHTHHTENIPLNIEISELNIQGQKVEVGTPGSPLQYAISESKEITLNHRQASAFGLTYTTNCFGRSSEIHYAITIDGAKWNEVGTQHQISLSNLNPGRHQIGIKASYDGKNWDEQGSRYLTVNIRPPFYDAWWAWIIYLLLTAIAVHWIYSSVHSRMEIRRKLEEESRAKTQAEEMNKQKVNFFANVSHDLKTPLTLIVSPLQKIVADHELDGRVKNAINVVLRNAKRMWNLLDELVMLGKIEMGHLSPTVQPGDILNFIDRICDIFRVFATDNGINFIVHIEQEHKEVWFSAIDTERIVYNLLSNAFKFTPPGGTIRIRARLIQNEQGMDLLDLSVRDSGIGIAPEQQAQLFENYYSAPKKETSGTGMGLPLTRSLVQLHFGTISVSSEVGKGSTFHVQFNVSREAYDSSHVSNIRIESEEAVDERFIHEHNEYLQQVKVETQTTEEKRSRILIVEDNQELRELLQQLFEHDFEVSTAANGEEGYEMAIHMMPDLIISDVMMPGMDGFEMTRKLKSELLTSHIPIVLLTAKVHEQDRIEGFEMGADAYIPKPFNNQVLELQVRNLLNTRNSNILRFKHNMHVDIRNVARNPRDEKFLNSIVEIIMKNLSNEKFSIHDITTALAVSRSFLHLKLKNLVDQSATEFIRTIKMKEARKMLMSGMNVSETSYAVGISDPNYFTKCFKKQFGQTPSEFLKSIR